MGIIEGDAPCSDNDWEAITKGGDPAIKRWIASQLDGKSCIIVLVGASTANRKWINYEIIEGWNNKKAVFGIHIHGLKNSSGVQTTKGLSPFDFINVGSQKLSTLVRTYDPPYSDSTAVYNYIRNNLGDWIETALKTRASL